MSSSFLIAARWDGATFVPLIRFRNLCDENYVVGEIYSLEPLEQRSMKSHSHYFAALTEMWRSLPDDVAIRFPTVESLRKWALIHEGFADSKEIVATSKAEAQRIAAFTRGLNDHAVVSVREHVVRVFTAKSQSLKAMGAQDFKRSKDSVLEYVASMIGVKKEEAKGEGER
jgi:hypothetical protein